jgi:hypothetical protein
MSSEFIVQSQFRLILLLCFFDGIGVGVTIFVISIGVFRFEPVHSEFTGCPLFYFVLNNPQLFLLVIDGG